MGIALGAGTTSATTRLAVTETEVTADDDVIANDENDDDVLTTFTATAETARVVIDTDDPTTVVDGTITASDIPDERNELVHIDGELLSSGRWVMTDVEVPALFPTLQSPVVVGEIEAAIEELDLEALVEEVELLSVLERVVAVIETFEISESEAAAIADELADIAGELLGFDITGSLKEAFTQIMVDLLANPTPTDIRILLELLIPLAGGITEASDASDLEALASEEPTDEFTFESLVDFLITVLNIGSISDLEDQLIALVADLDEGILGEVAAFIAIEFEPEPTDGAFDPRMDDPALLTSDITTITAVTSFVDLPNLPGLTPGDVDIALDMALTSGESGARSGELSIAEGGDTGTATLVENEFIAGIDEFELAALIESLELDDLLELVVSSGIFDEEIEALLADLIEALPDELGLDPDEVIDELNIEAILGSLELEAIADALDIDHLVAGLIDDAAGRHAVEFDLEFEFDEPLDLDDIVLPTAPIGGGESLPQDRNNDGLFEDIDGDGDLTVADVQLLFEEMAAIPEGETQFYNFSGTDPDRVTIFDVQALFNRLD